MREDLERDKIFENCPVLEEAVTEGSGREMNKEKAGNGSEPRQLVSWAAIGLTILAQGVSFGYLKATVDGHDRRIEAIETDHKQIPSRIEFTDLKDAVRRIEGKIDLLAEQEAASGNRSKK